MRENFVPFLLLTLCACSSPRANGGAGESFETSSLAGWVIASTGGEGPDAAWEITADAAAVSGARVLRLSETRHDSEDRFNLAWDPTLRFSDGHIAVRARADAGEIDQGGGLAWRVQGANDYYICRINPLESNIRVYVVAKGVRRQLATAKAQLTVGRWYDLEIEHRGAEITCSLDGRAMLRATDSTISKPGAVALWTKADARTSFDDLNVEAAPR